MKAVIFFMLGLSSIANAETHTFKKGAAIIDCACTVGNCPLKGSHEQFDWSTPIFTPASTLDLDQVCYHKQGSADPQGAVACCDFGADKTPGTYTTGKVGRECPGVDDPKKCK